MVSFLDKLSIQKSEVMTVTPRSSFSSSSALRLSSGSRLISSEDFDPELIKVSSYVLKASDVFSSRWKSEASDFVTKIRRENIKLLEKENTYEKYRKEDTSWFYELPLFHTSDRVEKKLCELTLNNIETVYSNSLYKGFYDLVHKAAELMLTEINLKIKSTTQNFRIVPKYCRSEAIRIVRFIWFEIERCIKYDIDYSSIADEFKEWQTLAKKLTERKCGCFCTCICTCSRNSRNHVCNCKCNCFNQCKCPVSFDRRNYLVEEESL